MPLLRYAGSKDKLVEPLLKLMPPLPPGGLFETEESGIDYREPFFGSGAFGFRVMELLPKSSSLWLNDKDPGIAALWHSVWRAPEKLCALIAAFEPTPAAYEQFKAEDGQPCSDSVQRGFQKLALHQISFSGLGAMSGGPIGGKAQASAYKVGCRWNPKVLMRTVRRLHERLGDFRSVKITGGDYEELLQRTTSKTFLYLDPPYVDQGPALYKHAMGRSDHIALSDLLWELDCPWLLSYDDDPLVRELYARWCTLHAIKVRYSGAVERTKRAESVELAILPDN